MPLNLQADLLLHRLKGSSYPYLESVPSEGTFMALQKAYYAGRHFKLRTSLLCLNSSSLQVA